MGKHVSERDRRLLRMPRLQIADLLVGFAQPYLYLYLYSYTRHTGSIHVWLWCDKIQ